MQLLQSDAHREVRRVQEQMSELEVLGGWVAAAMMLSDLRYFEVTHDIALSKSSEKSNLV